MKGFAYSVLCVYLGLMFLSLFQMSTNMTMSHSMSGMSDCPFMTHDEVVCGMNLNDHIGAWKSLFLTHLPAHFMGFLVGAVVALIASVAPHLIYLRAKHPPPIQWRQLTQATYAYAVRAYQDLLSSGVLNPKVY